jgi:ABC-2 type transport system permease protein
VLSEILRFEWRYHTRQATFVAAVLFFFLLGVVMTLNGSGPDNVAVNSPYIVMKAFAFMTLFSLFAVAIFASNAVLRDDDHRMRDIVASTPVSRTVFVAGRFGGAFLATLTVVGFSILGILAATYSPWMDAARVQAFDVRPYLCAFGVMTVPNVLFTTALLFLVALLTRNAIATYSASVVLYLLYFACAALTNSPVMAGSKPGGGGGLLPSLLDPFGMTAFFDVTGIWAAVAKSTWFVPLAGTLLWNRLLCVAGAAILGIVAVRKAGRPVRERRAPLPARPVAKDGRTTAVVTPSSPYLARTLLEFRAFFTKATFLLFALWAALAGSEAYSDVLTGEYNSTRYPHTGLILASMQQPLWLVGMILILYYSAEMFWREQRVRMASVVDSTPVSGRVILAAKWTALGLLMASLIACSIATGMALQISQGFFAFQPLVYLSFFYFAGLPLLLYAAAALFIQSLSPNRYAGMILFLLFAIGTRRAPSFGLEHPLWRFAYGPPVPYSEMNGFGHFPRAFSIAMLHWTSWAFLFLALATILWRRIGLPVGERLRALAKPGRAVGALAALVLATGGWMFYETNVASVYEPDAEGLAWKANYEKKYKSIGVLPQPRITAVESDVDLFPRQLRNRIRGRYALLNDTAKPMASFYVSVRRDARLNGLAVPHAVLAESDAAFGMYRFDLDPPLAPGAATELRFDLASGSEDGSVVGNGTLLLGFLRYPTLGYRRTYELRDPRERQQYGLRGPGLLSVDDVGGEEDSRDQRVAFRATVSTDADQTAVTSGSMEGTWERGGRRWFRYRTESPIVNRFAIASARYRIARRQQGDVAIEVLYDEAHAVNVPHMLETAAVTLDVMQARFGRYPHRVLRIAEVPSYAPFAGFATPGLVLLREDRAFLTDSRDPDRPDLIGRRVAHEVAHQWFGHRVVAASAPGASLITESLTKYAELLVIERMHGRDAVQQLLGIELDRYLRGRANDGQEEVPLWKVGDQDYLYYSKGAIVLWATRDLLGEEAMNRAIRRMMDVPHPTSGDLLSALGGGPLVDSWMKDIVLYDLRIDSARAARRPDGRWDVTLLIDAARHRGDETALPLREPIDVAVDGISRRVELHDGRNEVVLIVDAVPKVAAVDPRMTRIDRNPRDNEKTVE